MIKRLLISLFFVLPGIFLSQEPGDFVWPIDTPHIITGNYGELRPNHFHMGWDFSTNAKVNLPVYAIADGFVSRIKISAVGYGKALYITHPGNFVSVFAHLTSYAPKISAVVKQEHYSKQRYEVEIFPDKDQIRVKKGELIGYSGNSGGSTGPHLHFEIRDRESEVPLNLRRFYNLKDTVKPAISHVAFYDLSDTSRPVVNSILKLSVSRKDSLFLQKDSVILKRSTIGFAFAGFDRFVHKGNPNVIYSAELSVDGKKIFSYAFNNLSFSEQRYVNEFSERIDNIKFQKCFLPAIYPAGIYQDCLQKGRIVLADTNFHELKLKVSDEHGNLKTLLLWIKTKKINGYLPPVEKGAMYVDCARDVYLSSKGLNIAIPARTLYYPARLEIDNGLDQYGKFSIKPADINFASPLKISFAVPAKYAEKRSAIVLKNNSIVYSPLADADSLRFSVYAFGNFELALDTLAPKIRTQLSPTKIRKLKKVDSFSFLIRDNLSGIRNYSLFLDDKWVLAEFDAKSNLLTYFVDEATPPGTLNFRVEAEDKAGNHATFKYVLKRAPGR